MGLPLHALRLALDLGTTTLTGRLLDAAGTVRAETRCLNPQQSLGSDVIRRLEAALGGNGAELQRLLVVGIAQLVDELTAMAGLSRTRIDAVAACANPGVSALLCGDDVHPLLFPPHRPRDLTARILSPAALGLDLSVPLFLFPAVSGYVGGDLVAFVYGQVAPENGMAGAAGPATLYVDLGTNAEIALVTPQGWLATSVAAGPAFEGGEVSCGMAAGPGAVTGVVREGDRLRLQVIGDGPPRGLAGSGLFSAIAVAVEAGLIDRDGRIVAPQEVDSNLVRYLDSVGDTPSLVLYRAAAGVIRITQGDVRAFQLAKGAVRAGIDCLLQRAGVASGMVAQAIFSGAFGLSLDFAALKSVALLPEDMVKKTLCVPSGALDGVSRLLLAADGPSAVATLAGRIKPYPLSGTPAFERAFLASLDFTPPCRGDA